MIKISQKLKSQLWWLIISVDYDYSRITVAEHELTDEVLTLWLEDKQDYKNSIDECLQVDIRIRDMARIIKAENLNSYEGTKLHPTKNFAYKARIEINTPVQWYKDDASVLEQQWAREAILKTLLTQLVEAGAASDYDY
ncbi:hypothetical protein SAMN05192574_103523 [Mucilaginibacter gossypiicola]|uniref:Uncharacterized protein n=1 Tax=Mucilaginibacter gossypiicola TaxID=551995 RepID=A0A1H8HJ98_9SPHI|nr:hypothetical protein [Mucilaginibacter gossypiicola]SEN56159.1 hypothetical protein SAMN05192574_103523 [Mucilaginibacter gossypiicola]